MHFGQDAIAGESNDDLVNLMVELKILVTLVLAMQADDQLMHLLESFEIVHGHSPAGESSRHSLDAGNRLKKFVYVFDGNSRHSRATIRQQFDQSLARQYLERLAQGCARDIEMPANLGLDKTGARAQLAFDDHVAQLIDCLLVEGLPPNRTRPWQLFARVHRVPPVPLGHVRGPRVDRS